MSAIIFVDVSIFVKTPFFWRYAYIFSSEIFKLNLILIEAPTAQKALLMRYSVFGAFLVKKILF